jgi:hypothetical protein
MMNMVYSSTESAVTWLTLPTWLGDIRLVAILIVARAARICIPRPNTRIKMPLNRLNTGCFRTLSALRLRQRVTGRTCNHPCERKNR